MNSIIKYSLEDFKRISENFDAELDTDIINSLLEIKKNNRFTKRKTPLKLKYTISNTWRLNENKNDELSNEEILSKTITSSLNKLSNDNFDIIYNLIKKDMDTYSDVSFEIVIDIIFDKSLEENFYCKSYSRLLDNLVRMYPDDTQFKTDYLIKKCRSFYNSFLNENINDLDLQNEDYDIVCSVNEKKSKIISGFILISTLFNFKIINYDFIKEIFLKNIECFNAVDTNYLGIYIDSIIVMIETSFETLKSTNIDDYNDIYIPFIKSNINNRDRIIPKYVFKMKDLLDKLDINIS